MPVAVCAVLSSW